MISRSKRGLQISHSLPHVKPLWQCLAVCPRYAKLKLDTRVCTLQSSASVSWRIIGYPRYTRNRTCALPSPSPLHHAMAKIVPVVQLAAHAESSTLYGRWYGRTPKFFRLDELLLFRIIMGLRCACLARCELQLLCLLENNPDMVREKRELKVRYLKILSSFRC